MQGFPLATLRSSEDPGGLVLLFLLLAAVFVPGAALWSDEDSRRRRI